MNNIKELTNKEILSTGYRYNVPESQSFVLDTMYMGYLFSLDTGIYRSEQKNHLQPLQVLYYDSTGTLSSYHINCFVGGFPNLKWNRLGAFDQFPPKQQAPLDTILSFKFHREFITKLETDTICKNESPDYSIIVYWSRFMGRQSKRLIKLVQRNIALVGEKNIKVYYVNNDNAYVELVE